MFRPLIITIILNMILFSNLSALETDQYMTWLHELNDSTKMLNAFFNKKTWETIQQVNQLPFEKRKQLSCHNVYYRILKNFNKKKRFDFILGIETWIYDNPTIDRYPRRYKRKIGVVNESIYRNSWLFKLKIFGINIRAGGVYFGIDKLGHIIEVGELYYKIYTKNIRRGATKEQAILAMFRKGIAQEKTYYGYWISGIFSFADLEANYQGMLFHQKFCQTQRPYLEKNHQHQKWLFREKINIADFITPYFDESFNTNIYSKSRFHSIYPHLKKYCAIRQQNHLKQRIQTYQKRAKKSIAMLYLDKLIAQKKLDNPKKYHLETICQPNYKLPALYPKPKPVWEF